MQEVTHREKENKTKYKDFLINSKLGNIRI
mgnify:FL=1